MEQFESIKKYFRPIQPTAGREDENIIYQEIKPTSALENYVYCHWRLSTKQPLKSPFKYRVVSDGCIDVFFNLKNPAESFVMGFCRKYTEFEIGKEFDYGGIRFYPSMFPVLFDVSAKMLSDKDQPLKLILPELASLIAEQVYQQFHLSIPCFDKYLASKIQKIAAPIDERYFAAFLEILKRNGNLETENELSTGLSPRQLRRLFNYYIGTSPKSFCQVVRFQYILNAKPSSQSLKENKIYFDVGFFDQAHFIKNFTKFYGVTPSKAFE